MAKFCGKCGTQVSENTKFCTKCGYKLAGTDTNIDVDMPESVQNQIQVRPVVTKQQIQEAPMPQFKTPPMSEQPISIPQEPKKKKKTGKILLIVLLILALLAGIVTVGLVVYTKHFKESQEAFMKSLEACTDRNLIAFYYDDYDADGKNEAYAVVGNDGESAKNYSNADIWFINVDGTEPIDENVSGHANGEITQGKTKFISFERKTGKDDETVSDIYGVKDNKSYEPEISGKYKNVHQDGEEIVAEVIETGKEIELKINDKGEIEVGGEIEDTEENEDNEEKDSKKNKDTENLIADSDDFDELIRIIGRFNWVALNFLYSCDDASAYEEILQHLLSCLGCNPIYDYFFPNEPVDVTVTDSACDPLKKFVDSHAYVGKVSADNVDWIIENVFCIPVSRSEKGVGESKVYYYEDYYYFEFGAAGDLIPDVLISDRQKNDDNSYTVTVDYVDNSGQDGYGSEIFQCKLQMIDGKRQWRITSIVEDNSGDLLTSKERLKVDVSASPTASELKSVLIGGWNPISQSDTGTIVYTFNRKGNCITYGCGRTVGTYTISDDLTLKLDFKDTYLNNTKTLKWNANAKTSKTGWYIDADGYLIIEGISYGKVYDENCSFDSYEYE